MLLVNIVASGELYLLGGSPSLWAVESLHLSALWAINKNQELILFHKKATIKLENEQLAVLWKLERNPFMTPLC